MIKVLQNKKPHDIFFLKKLQNKVNFLQNSKSHAAFYISMHRFIKHIKILGHFIMQPILEVYLSNKCCQGLHTHISLFSLHITSCPHCPCPYLHLHLLSSCLASCSCHLTFVNHNYHNTYYSDVHERGMPMETLSEGHIATWSLTHDFILLNLTTATSLS